MYLLSKTFNLLKASKIFLLLTGILLVIVIQQIILPAMGVFFFGQWLIFIFIFLIGFFQEKGNFAILAAFLAGILIDLISGLFFGIFTISLFSVALLVKIAQQRIRLTNPFAFFLSLIFCALCFWGISYFLIYVFY